MNKPIPEGYRQDAMGNLVPEANIKEIDKLRNEIVVGIVEQAQEVRLAISGFQAMALGNIDAFVQVAAQDYDVKLGGRKGNVTLVSFDGRYKILRAVDESIAFNEQLEAAKALIDECLMDWTKDSSDNTKAIVGKAFEMNKAGEISTARVLGLRTINIEDARWKRAMEAIGNSVMVVGSKVYLRIYERMPDGSYTQISLNGSGC